MNPSKWARLSTFLRNTARSRIAWVFATIHMAWFFLAISTMSAPNPRFAALLETVQGSSTTLFAGRPFHFLYESIVMKLLILGDLPAMIAVIPIGLLLAPFRRLLHLNLYLGSYIGAALLLLIGTIQWMIIGKVVEVQIKAKRHKP